MYAQFLNMIPEASLVILIVAILLCDLCSANSARRQWMHPTVCTLLLLHTLLCFCPAHHGELSLFAGMYVSSPAISIMKALLSVATLIVTLQSRQWLTRRDTAYKAGEFYVILLSTLLGMNMMISAGHFLMFFLGLETASVPMACLVAFNKGRQNSAEAAAKYILTATFSSAVMLYGISLVYAATGTLYFADIATKLSSVALTPMLILALVLFFAGLGFKISLVPFHFWTADTYQGAPTAVTAYLSVASKGAATFALATILMDVFGSLATAWLPLLYVVIIASIVLANIMAIRQSNLKRFMAFSSISQAGYIVLAIVGNNAMTISALSYYVLVYIAANLAVFAIIATVEEQRPDGEAVNISTLNGRYNTNPRVAFLMTIARFSLAGIPPFAGMFSKFFVFMAALKAGSVAAYIVVFIALVNTVVSLYYYLLIVKAMYIRDVDATATAPLKTDSYTKIALALSTAGVLLCGIVSACWEYVNV